MFRRFAFGELQLYIEAARFNYLTTPGMTSRFRVFTSFDPSLSESKVATLYLILQKMIIV